MSEHILDRAVWNALSTRQSQVAVGGDFARRFSPEIGPLAASRDNSPQSLEALAELVRPTGQLVLMQADEIVLPPHVDVVMTAPGVQMVAERLPAIPKLNYRIEKLTEEDVPAMLALATLTKPGPFEAGTPKLGGFCGVKEKGVLVAMAGERMKHAGYTEVSAVCVHPSARGRGFARALLAKVATRILDRGETPYLHTFTTNTAAIHLYESLGFCLRRPVHIVVIARQGSGEASTSSQGRPAPRHP